MPDQFTASPAFPMIHVSRMFPMIHTGRMFLMAASSWTIPIVRMIPVTAENTSGGSEQGDGG
jgi:hypothetical protein